MLTRLLFPELRKVSRDNLVENFLWNFLERRLRNLGKFRLSVYVRILMTNIVGVTGSTFT